MNIGSSTSAIFSKEIESTILSDSELVGIYKEMLFGQATLNLSKKELGDVEAAALAEAMKDKKVITHTVNLRNNKFGPVGTRALAEALKVNETVRSLDLSQNNIGDEGGSALSETLLVNITLESLCLHYCKIGNAGGTAIASSLLTNKTLRALELLYNQISETGGSSFATAIKVNGSLTTFTYFGNEFNESGRSIISRELTRNRNLGTQKNALQNKAGIEVPWETLHQCFNKKDECWILRNPEKLPGKLRQCVYSLLYKVTSQQGYDGYGEWGTITSYGREPGIKFSFYKGEDPDLIKSLQQLNITIEKDLFSTEYVDFTVTSPNRFILEKLLIYFAEKGELTKEKAAEFLKMCPKK